MKNTALRTGTLLLLALASACSTGGDEDHEVTATIEGTGSSSPTANAAQQDPNIPVGLEIGNYAPDIEGTDLDGNAFKLSDYRGKVVMLDFWGDW